MKQFFRFSLLLLALLLPATATAHDFEVDGIYYNINGNEATVTYKGKSFFYGNEYSGHVTIPATVTYNGTTYSVTSIGYGAFYLCDGLCGELHIPGRVTIIGDSVFSSCSGLSGELHLPDNVTAIGDWAFSGCTGLGGELHLPDSLTMI